MQVKPTKIMYKSEPPEGGWGILVCIGMALPFISALGSMPSFGLVFGDFLKSLGEETSAIAVITSLFFSAMSFAGLFSSSLFNKYSLRTVGLAGGILYFIGSFLQIFVQTTWQLMIVFSIFQGVAFGLIVPTSYTTFNNYFITKRVTMMSFAQSLIGLGTMGYPVIMSKLLEWYGFRGCLAVLAAINAHAIFGMLVMHPVEWHMKKVPITDHAHEESAPKAFPSIEMIKTEYIPSSRKGSLKEFRRKREDHLEPLMALRGSLKELRKSSLDPFKSLKELRKPSLDPFKSLRMEEGISSSRASSIADLGNWTGAVVVSDRSELPPPSKYPQSKWQALVNFLDLTLLKDPVYVNIVLGISFALYSDIAFFTIQPMYLFELGYPKADTATIIAIGAAADLGSRIFLAFGSAFFTMPSRYVYLGGALFTVISRFAFLTTFDFVGMAIITAIMGFLRTWIHVPLPLVFAEYLPKERFPSGYGLFMFLQGNIMFAIGPVVGYIRDATNSYEITFHLLNFFMAACAVPWLMEIAWIRFCGKKSASTTQDVQEKKEINPS